MFSSVVSESSGSESSIEDRFKQIWEYRILWTNELDHLMSDNNVTLNDLAKSVIVLAGIEKEVLNNVVSPTFCVS